jgi:hypothetical protein
MHLNQNANNKERPDMSKLDKISKKPPFIKSGRPTRPRIWRISNRYSAETTGPVNHNCTSNSGFFSPNSPKPLPEWPAHTVIPNPLKSVDT